MGISRLLLISGAIGAGKSTVARLLREDYNFQGISSGDYLRSQQAASNHGSSRRQQQDLGDQLDIETDFLWIIDKVAVPAMEIAPDTTNWLFDAVRKPRQVEHFRAHFGSVVRHIHLTASESVLRDRYESRKQAIDASYDEAIRHPNEIAARALNLVAEHTFDTQHASPSGVAEEIFYLWEG